MTGLIALYAPAVIVLGLIVLLVWALWRRATGADELLLDAMLRRQGVFSLGPQSHLSAQTLGVAARRCANCAAQEHCRDWLDAGKREGYEAFCPNSELVGRLRT